MANSLINPAFRHMPYLMSRLSGIDHNPSHADPISLSNDGESVPADSFEVINANNKDIVSFVRNNIRAPAWGVLGLSRLVILTGEMEDMDDLHKIDKYVRSRFRYLLYIPGPKSDKLLDDYWDRSMYDRRGYLDYGISYNKDPTSGAVRDVGCFWGGFNDTAVVIIPGSPTVAGFNRVSTVMKKSDVMISHYPPAEVRDGKQNRLVSEARKIWKPKTHIYPEQGTGLILASGSDRIIGLPSRNNRYVLRWSREDLVKGSINSFDKNSKLKIPTSTRRKRA